MQQVRFDDAAALKARIGEPWSPFGRQVTLTQDMVNHFAELTHDPQWIHIDVERAQKESPLGTTIVHGFFVLSLLPYLRERPDLQIVGYRNILNYGADKLRFLSPVKTGSTVHARCRIVSVEPKPKGTLIAEECEVSVVGADRPALSYTMLLLFQP
ncbi:MAG TPA: MaoC family dehydratase [Pseudomonadota bacterium]|jgi:acyl dehydratase|nr:MaoC family dehydratase [Pseudomonadota bacterium]